MAHSHKLDIPRDIMPWPSYTVNILYCKQLWWGKGKVTMQGIIALLITIYINITPITPLYQIRSDSVSHRPSNHSS